MFNSGERVILIAKGDPKFEGKKAIVCEEFKDGVVVLMEGDSQEPELYKLHPSALQKELDYIRDQVAPVYDPQNDAFRQAMG